jgi:2-methylcitrate dehydratase PrpD
MVLLMKIRVEHQLRAEDIEEVTVWLTPLAMSVPPEGDPSYAPDPFNGGTPFDIVFNAPYQVAMILMGVPAGPEWYKPERYADSDVRAIMAKVKLGLDTETGLKIGQQARDEFTRRFKLSPGTGITVKARGQTFAGRCAYIPGDPWCPETRTPDSVLVEKFRAYGEPYLPKSKLDRALDALFELENVSDLTDLAQLLTRD